MIRRTLKVLAIGFMTVFALGVMAPMAGAAPKKAVKHRARHSTRVAAGASSTTTTRKPGTRTTTKRTRTKRTTTANKPAAAASQSSTSATKPK